MGMDVWLNLLPSPVSKSIKIIVVPFIKHCSDKKELFRSCYKNRTASACFRKEYFCERIVKCDVLNLKEQSECPSKQIRITVPFHILIIASVLAVFIIISVIGCTIKFIIFILQRKQKRSERGVGFSHDEFEISFQLQPNNVSNSEMFASSELPSYEQALAMKEDTPPPSFEKICISD